MPLNNSQDKLSDKDKTNITNMEDLLKHPGWILLCKSLDALAERSTHKLCTSKFPSPIEMEYEQALLKHFIEMKNYPRKFIEELRNNCNRKDSVESFDPYK
ncbi:MAG: hypothetical protein U9R08_02955 [Nanoarchaeota archaeon]|nr:hypothetical protein [Nanoarchaeota archaeon]